MEEILFKSKDDLDRLCVSEEKCIEYLIQSRWGDKPKCKKCHSDKRVYFIKSRKAFKCSSCNSHISIRKETIFENSNVPLRLWFKALWEMGTKKIGNAYCASKLVDDIGVSYKTAFYMLHKIREVMRVDNEDIVLEGIVEADELYSGAKLDRDNCLRAKVISADRKRAEWGLETEKERKSRENKTAKWEKKTKKKSKPITNKLQLLKESSGFLRNSLDLDLAKLEASYKKHHYKRNLICFLQRDVAEYSEKIENHKKKKLEIQQYGKLVINVMGRQKTDVDMEHITPLIEKKNELHKPIKYSKEIDPEKDIHGIKHLSTNGVENVNKHIRRFDKDYVKISFEHSHRYYFEYAFNFNSRGLCVGKRFMSLFKVALKVTASFDDIQESKKAYVYRPKRTKKELEKFK